MEQGRLDDPQRLGEIKKKNLGASSDDAQFENKSISISTAIFPGEPGLAGFTAAMDDGSGGDNYSYETYRAPVKSSSPTNQHLAFYRLS